MRTALLILALTLLLPAMAAAQTNIIVRPDESATRVQTNALGSDLTNCLVLEGVDPLDQANHFECLPTSAGAISEPHLISVVEGGGHVTVRAVTVRLDADGTSVVSAPSPNFKKVLDVPGPPRIMSGEMREADDLA